MMTSLSGESSLFNSRSFVDGYELPVNRLATVCFLEQHRMKMVPVTAVMSYWASGGF
jgi:hypothetical protein